MKQILGALIVAIALTGTSAVADPSEERGRVTNLPIPRFVSMKAERGYVRRGPSQTNRIDWVFQRSDMPLQVVGEYGHWRQVRDRDGASGWMHFMLLSGTRTVIVQEDLAPLHTRPDDRSDIRARIEAGVVASLRECEINWCNIRMGRTRGWVQKTQLWGVEADEILN